MKTFKGRVIAGGKWEGEAVVSHAGVNTLATFQKSAMANKSEVIASDQNNPDIYGKNITGKALCLPVTIGSTTGGLVIQTVCSMKINPACFLFSKHIDSLAASGIILAKVWEGSPVIAVDMLGDEFLETVKTGDKLRVDEDGTYNSVIMCEGITPSRSMWGNYSPTPLCGGIIPPHPHTFYYKSAPSVAATPATLGALLL